MMMSQCNVTLVTSELSLSSCVVAQNTESVSRSLVSSIFPYSKRWPDHLQFLRGSHRNMLCYHLEVYK